MPFCLNECYATVGLSSIFALQGDISWAMWPMGLNNESSVQLTLIFVEKSKIKMARRVLEEDLKNIEFETSEDVDVTPTFDHMGLREDLLRGIYAYGLYNFIRSQTNL